MKLRIANISDFEIVKNMATKAIAESPYSDMVVGILDVDTINSFLNPNTANDTICLLALDKDRVVGLAAFEKIKIGHTSISLARLALIYVEASYRKKTFVPRVLKALEYWGKQTGCAQTYVSVSKGWADLTKINYKEYETVYMKEIK